MEKLVIIGGSDAGISAALRAKELGSDIDVTIAVADLFPNFSICGLPFYLSGEIQDWKTLAHRTTEEIEEKGIRLLLGHKADMIDPRQKQVRIIGNNGHTHFVGYDRLLIGTGAVSAIPPIKGLDVPGVFLLRRMEDSFEIQRFLIEKKVRSAVIIGGGYIGMEMADALTYRGVDVTVVEYAQTVLTTVDASLGILVREELEDNGVRVKTGTAVKEIDRKDDHLVVMGSTGLEIQTDMVLVAAGSRPSVELARAAGVKIGSYGAIEINREMKTNLPDVFAAGDCVETWHRFLEKYTYLPLGTTAHKQGRIAGENMAGGEAEFKGSLGTQVVKIFDLVAARTGLRDKEALEAGYEPMTVEFETWDHKAYYPGAKKMRILMSGDRTSHALLGVQILGNRKSEVSKRIDIVAAALFHRMKVEELNDLDLSYTPPLSSPWDPVQMAAQAWLCSSFQL
jgi:NADPH-dependent 2,4-dienoyl-CoA reductase/sulfur reductase-like enzyme